MGMFSKKGGGGGGGLGRGIALADDEAPPPRDLKAPPPRDLNNEDHRVVVGDIDAVPVHDFVPVERPMSKKEVAARVRAEKAEARAQSKANKASSKGRKGKATPESIAEESARLSNRVLMEFYPGLNSADAVETAKNWALNHFENPTGCFYYVQEVPGGWGIEVQEGVGKAYLPSVVDLCLEHPGQVVIVPMVRRKMTVAFSPGSGEFEAQVLREGADPVVIENSLTAHRGPAMIPVMKQYMNTLYGGMAAFGLGSFALLASILLYGFDPKAKVPPEWRVTDATQLPVMQWNKLQADDTGSYVVRLEFQDGAWRVVRQESNANVSLSTAPALGDSAIVAGVVPATGVADPAGGAPPAGSLPPVGTPPVSPPGTPGAAPSGAPPQITLPSPQ